MNQIITLAQLQDRYGDDLIPYVELLQTSEWLSFRQRIVKRDGNRCKKCHKGKTERVVGGNVWIESVIEKDSFIDLSLQELGWTNEEATVEIEFEETAVIDAEKPYHLEVHHKYYVFGMLPWQYPEKALVTLCNWCHQALHDNGAVPFYDNAGQVLKYTPCHRCNGSGSFPEYNHVQSGVCFRCGGARYEELIAE